MSTTKPIAESGWTREWPTETGFYWTREHPHDTTPILVEVRRNRLTICGEAIRCDVREAFEASEFLGPVTVPDFEQLIQLQGISNRAVDVMDMIFSHLKLDYVKQIADELREALTPKGEQS